MNTNSMTTIINRSRDNQLRCFVTRVSSTKLLSMRRQNDLFLDPNTMNIHINNV